MKTPIIYLAMIVMLSVFQIKAQYVKDVGEPFTAFTITGRAGVGQSVIQNKDYAMQNMSPNISLSAGVLTNYYFNSRFSVGSGFIIISKGATFRYDIEKKTDRYELIYGEIPLTANYTWRFKKVAVHGCLGPSMNYAFSSDLIRYYDNGPSEQYFGDFENQGPLNIERVDYSVVVGLGLNTLYSKKGSFFTDVRLSNAFTSFGMIDEQKVYNHYYSFSIGYTF